MKKLLLVLGFVAIAAVSFAQKEKIKQQANQLAQATVKGNYDQLIDGMYQPMVKASGGRATLLQALKKGIGQMKAAGVTFEAASVGEPGEIKTIGKRRFSLVPQSITMRTKDGTLRTKSNLLAISDDGGAHWSFLDVSKTEAVYQYFPEIKGKITIPAQQQPVFTPNK